jgi:Flp pilus assembly protein CpaB
MSASTQRLLARIGRWPRRIAALLCLLLAAGSALVPHAPATASSRAHGLGAELRRGEVAVPVPIASGVGSVRPDDQVGVVAPPADGDTVSEAVLVADHLRVITVTQPAELAGDTAAVVTVATDRAGALQLARYAARPLLMIVDQLP